jgi:dTMP kinase
MLSPASNREITLSQGHFITFEGLDGSGKSTQLASAAEYLRGKGMAVVTTGEPGGTELGQKIRSLVVNAAPGELSPIAELALMFAARVQHIGEVIRPALHRGEIVLCDRFTDSSVAYQGYGHGVQLRTIRTMEELFCQGVRPELTVVLDIDAPTSAQRTATRNLRAGEAASRYEQEGREFFERVRTGYQEIARQEPERVRVVDASGSSEEVQRAVREAVDGLLKER